MSATRSNPNVFGNAVYSGEVTNPDIRLLTSGIEGELSAKLMPWLRRLKQNEGTEVNACLMWSDHRRNVEAANTHIIPSFIRLFIIVYVIINACYLLCNLLLYFIIILYYSTIDPNEFLAFKMNFIDIIRPEAIVAFMNKVMDPKKTRLLFVPHIDILMEVAMRAGLWVPWTTAFGRLRGANVVLLATAYDDISQLQVDLKDLFSTGESIQIRKVTTPEAQGFFQPLLSVPYYQENQKRFAEDPDSDTTHSAALTKLGKELTPLLAKAINFSVRNEIQDSLDMRGDLVKAVASKLNAAQHAAELKKVVARYHQAC